MEVMEHDHVLMNIELPRDVRGDFKIAAKLRGGSMSTLVHQFVVRTIREEKERHPEKFPDYKPEPIDTGDTIDLPENVKEAVDILYETFGGDRIDPELPRITASAVKQTQDAELNKGQLPTILPGQRKAG